MNRKEKIKKATNILKKRGVNKLNLYNFGIYYQYEMAGRKINRYLLDEWDEPFTEEDFDELGELLSFTDNQKFLDKLGFPDEGQNTLIFTDKGEFIYETFRI